MVRPKRDRWETSYRHPGEGNWPSVTPPKNLVLFLLSWGSGLHLISIPACLPSWVPARNWWSPQRSNYIICSIDLTGFSCPLPWSAQAAGTAGERPSLQLQAADRMRSPSPLQRVLCRALTAAAHCRCPGIPPWGCEPAAPVQGSNNPAQHPSQDQHDAQPQEQLCSGRELERRGCLSPSGVFCPVTPVWQGLGLFHLHSPLLSPARRLSKIHSSWSSTV